MTQLSRPETARGLIDEYESFAALIEHLSDAQWHAPSRCDGFEVRDVAGHVVGLAEDVVRGVPGSRTAQEEAESLRAFSGAEVAKHLREAARTDRPAARRARRRRVGGSEPRRRPDVRARRADALVRRVSCTPTTSAPRSECRRSAVPDSRASVEYLAHELGTRGWGPAQLALTGIPTVNVGTGGTAIVKGDPLQFVLAATGRADPAPLGLDATVNIYADS